MIRLNATVCMVLIPAALFSTARNAGATDISGTISTTLTIMQDSRLVGNVSCNLLTADYTLAKVVVHLQKP